MSQCKQLLDLFRNNHNILTLGEIMRTNLAAEYRARMTDLRKKGYRIELIERNTKAPSANVYQLSEPLKIEANGQACFL